MNTNKEFLTKMIRVSPSVKKRMEIFQGGDSANSCIDRMITFFEITGFNPRYASRKRELRTLSELSSPRNGIYSSPYLRNSPP